MSKTLSIKGLIKQIRPQYPVLKGKHLLKSINKLAKEYQNSNPQIKIEDGK